MPKGKQIVDFLSTHPLWTEERKHGLWITDDLGKKTTIEKHLQVSNQEHNLLMFADKLHPINRLISNVHKLAQACTSKSKFAQTCASTCKLAQNCVDTSKPGK